MDNKKMLVEIERMFDASSEIVWKMWTNANRFETWYGPNGFSIDVIKMDVVVGGEQLVCMIMPDGENQMYTTGFYKEVIENKKLVYSDSPCTEEGEILEPEAMGMPKGMHMETEVTIELIESEGKTKMIMKHAGVPEGARGGWNQAFDKMAIAIDELE